MTRGPSDDETGIEILEIVGYERDDDEPRRPRSEGSGAQEPGRLSEVVVRLSRAREEGRAAGIRLVLQKLLPALDALEACVRQEPDRQALEHAVRVALRQIWDVFREHDLERIEGTGVPFDPAVHEAAQVTPTDRVPPNTVLDVLRVGYALAGALVRPALVRVSAAPGAPTGDAPFTGRIGPSAPGRAPGDGDAGGSDDDGEARS
ncbi:MAG: nucleotide exchange factor GrpE [Acidobacteria bacterium]|nr:MAG: nucleotide exchange factor GrpE [Acidobacteriota bacterium]